MKVSSVIFAALFTAGINAHAIYIPGITKTQIFQCDSENLKTKIYKETEGDSVVVVEAMDETQNAKVLLNEKVTELKNKTHTVYTSDELVLKITHHPSGHMPGTLFVDKEAQLEKVNLECQIVYSIMDQAAAI